MGWSTAPQQYIVFPTNPHLRLLKNISLRPPQSVRGRAEVTFCYAMLLVCAVETRRGHGHAEKGDVLRPRPQGV